MRVSNDNGATFGPMLMLATNGTIGGGRRNRRRRRIDIPLSL